ncbi:Predicted phosphatases [Faecalitalea cylindroides T2-87]|uniref:Predicted phosphatases n=1 Tax=Faecalitalea cylindroides T2-87 TaxID=717960 RepID=D4JET3_9FIRM|nr:Predicted phosphatases [Faecalitalea cylindroides T2-87]
MKKDFCLIFDMDGTLWDATGSILNSANEVLEKEKGWKDYLDLDTLRRVMGLEIEEIANIYFPELEQEEKMDLIYKVMDNENLYLSKHGGILYPNVESTLQILSQKYDLMIVTNAQEGYTDAMYQSHGLKKYFTDELTYGETMKPKGQTFL